LKREDLRRIAANTLRVVPDRPYLDFMYRRSFGKKIDWDDPKTFNEKLNWLKVNDRRPEYVTMVDKAAVKDHVAKSIGREHIIPTLGVYESFDEIDFDALPDRFVLKCTHDSGGIVICRDKSRLDRAAAKSKLEKSLKSNFYWFGREWPYKDVEPRILAETYMEDPSDGDLCDYKLFCFDGKPRIALVCSERYAEGGLREDFFDMDWNHLDMQRARHGNADVCPACPSRFDEMKVLAGRIAKGMPFVRIDFYEISGKVLFGEITFFPSSGFEGFIPTSWDEEMGSWITLPKLPRS